MKESLKNWIDFFHKTNLSSEEADSLYHYMTRFSPGSVLSVFELQRHFCLSDSKTQIMITDLISSGLVVAELNCPECESTIEFPSELSSATLLCGGCGQEISYKDIPCLIISDKASYLSQLKKKLEDETYEMNADLLAQIGASQQYLIYLIADIEGSQTLQRDDNERYVEYLSYLWINIWPKVIRLCEKPCLPVFAKGDQVSIVLSTITDASRVIAAIPAFIKKDSFRISVYVGQIAFSETDRKGFMRSLDGKWDLNTPSVTDVYRKAHQIHPQVWSDSDTNYKVKICFLDELNESKNKINHSFREEPYCFRDKHENEYKGKILAGKI